MSMVRLQIVLDPVEAEVLSQWAASELRDPRDQIRFVLRQALERRGLLQPTNHCLTTVQGEREAAEGNVRV